MVQNPVIGLIGKAVAPGDRTKFPLWLTVLCGVVGMLVGSFVYWGLFGSNNKPFDGHEATWDIGRRCINRTPIGIANPQGVDSNGIQLARSAGAVSIEQSQSQHAALGCIEGMGIELVARRGLNRKGRLISPIAHTVFHDETVIIEGLIEGDLCTQLRCLESCHIE